MKACVKLGRKDLEVLANPKGEAFDSLVGSYAKSFSASTSADIVFIALENAGDDLPARAALAQLGLGATKLVNKSGGPAAA